MKIDKFTYIDVVWPDENLIHENVLNNNSLVCKLRYKNLSILFTGDIEKVAEERLVRKYRSTNKLNATILKVAHHGSKSSSTEQFLEMVQPKIALIGVGANNNFGHPSEHIIARLQRFRC